MKRDGYIMDEITAYSNIYAAIEEVLAGTKRKNSSVGCEILAHRDKEIQRIADELRSTMTMCGAAALKDITRDKIWRGRTAE